MMKRFALILGLLSISCLKAMEKADNLVHIKIKKPYFDKQQTAICHRC